MIEAAAEHEIERADFLLVLNKNENIIPAVAKLEGPQAAAFFMLGETQGTSAGGADEAGKFLRVPGTNPFFPALHDLQGNRFLELLEEHPLEVFLMNTGRVGGAESVDGSKKVKIRHSSAIVKGIAEGTIEWERDPDFGYLVAAHVPGIDDDDLDVLQPRRLYEAAGRMDEYERHVAQFKRERAEYLGAVREPQRRDRRRGSLAADQQDPLKSPEGRLRCAYRQPHTIRGGSCLLAPSQRHRSLSSPHCSSSSPRRLARNAPQAPTGTWSSSRPPSTRRPSRRCTQAGTALPSQRCGSTPSRATQR